MNADIQRFLDDERLPLAYADVMERWHRPIVNRLKAAALAQPTPLVVGVAGAQGSGKSTLAKSLALLLNNESVRSVVLSLDDFYLTRKERFDLSAKVHPLLMTRGVPGTHDIALLKQTLTQLQTDEVTRLPQFDKATDDRRSEWHEVRGILDVILLEGWCVGATAQDEQALQTPINELEALADADRSWRRYVNDKLSRDYQEVFASINQLVFIQAPSFNVVLEWRWEQERKLTQTQGDSSRAMTRKQLKHFIAHYERVTRWMLLMLPERADVLLQLDAHRNVVALNFR